jgi:hypothetical protein
MLDFASFFHSSKTTETTKAVNPIVRIGFSLDELLAICAANSNMVILFF